MCRFLQSLTCEAYIAHGPGSSKGISNLTHAFLVKYAPVCSCHFRGRPVTRTELTYMWHINPESTWINQYWLMVTSWESWLHQMKVPSVLSRNSVETVVGLAFHWRIEECFAIDIGVWIPGMDPMYSAIFNHIISSTWSNKTYPYVGVTQTHRVNLPKLNTNPTKCIQNGTQTIGLHVKPFLFYSVQTPAGSNFHAIKVQNATQDSHGNHIHIAQIRTHTQLCGVGDADVAVDMRQGLCHKCHPVSKPKWQCFGFTAPKLELPLSILNRR